MALWLNQDKKGGRQLFVYAEIRLHFGSSVWLTRLAQTFGSRNRGRLRLILRTHAVPAGARDELAGAVQEISTRKLLGGSFCRVFFMSALKAPILRGLSAATSE